jgi:predicted XRE-type DNA-binding protein
MIEDEDPIPDLKEQLRREILSLVGSWDQYVAAERLGIDQPRMSDLKRGRLERFSLEKLIRVFASIDQSVEITVVGPTRIAMFQFRRPRKGWTPPPCGPRMRRGPTHLR